MTINSGAFNVFVIDGAGGSSGGIQIPVGAGFFVAIADAAGARIVASELLLSPGPSQVIYPRPAYEIRECVDSRVVIQQGIRDKRQRTWAWLSYPANESGYAALWSRLKSLNAAYRQRYTPTPFVWVKENITQELKRQDILTGTATSGTSATLTDSSQTWGALAEYDVEIVAGTGIGQSRKIITNSATQLTVGYPWVTAPNATSAYAIHGWVNDWFRVRVLEVSRAPASEHTLRYDETRFTFVVDDPAFNYLG